MILTFALLAIITLTAVTIDLSPRKFVAVEDSDIKLYAGSEIITKKSRSLAYESTTVILDKRTNFTVKKIDDDQLTFFTSRGHWSITPDRQVVSCTRAVCATTSSKIDIRYYTPGEIVEIKASGKTLVTYHNLEYELSADDRIKIDELTGHTVIQSPSEGIDTSSTP